MLPFCSADILLPTVDDMEKWAVIACDQFVSQPEYWETADAFVGEAPSALRLILPEAFLDDNRSARVEAIHRRMEAYLQSSLLRTYPNSFVYVERTLKNGAVRKGVVGAMDLCAYDFSVDSKTAIRATEETVIQRVPPRMEIRQDAVLELPHVLLLCDDTERLLIDSLTAKRDRLPLVYDFELMADGGQIRGYLVSGEDEKEFTAALKAYGDHIQSRYGKHAVMYAVGDGNHSIAAAKACYEATKSPLARYALVELENIHDDAQVFHPIHRIVKNTDPQALLKAMEDKLGSDEGVCLEWHTTQNKGTITVAVPQGKPVVGVVQEFLDEYLHDHPEDMDYIHDDDALISLSQSPNTFGILLPPMDKSTFFPTIIRSGTLPRKAFSMGHATEKRYYLEARRIK